MTDKNRSRRCWYLYNYFLVLQDSSYGMYGMTSRRRQAPTTDRADRPCTYSLKRKTLYLVWYCNTGWFRTDIDSTVPSGTYVCDLWYQYVVSMYQYCKKCVRTDSQSSQTIDTCIQHTIITVFCVRIGVSQKTMVFIRAGWSFEFLSFHKTKSLRLRVLHFI